MSGWPSGLRRQTQAQACTSTSVQRFLVSIGGVGSNPTSDKVFWVQVSVADRSKCRWMVASSVFGRAYSISLLVRLRLRIDFEKDRCRFEKFLFT